MQDEILSTIKHLSNFCSILASIPGIWENSGLKWLKVTVRQDGEFKYLRSRIPFYKSSKMQTSMVANYGKIGRSNGATYYVDLPILEVSM
jgi:hypothetical protein